MDAEQVRQTGAFGAAVRSQRGWVVTASVLVTVHQILEVLVPVTIGVMIDRAIALGDGSAAVRWLLVLAVQFAVLSAAGCTAVWVDERARRGAAHTVRTALAARLLDERGGVEEALPGEALSLSTVETARLGDGVGAVIVGVGAVAGVLGGAAILFSISFWLGAAVVAGLPVVLLVVQRLAEPLVERADSHQKAVGVAAGVAADLFQGLRVLKGLGADRAAALRYRAASQQALSAGLSAVRVESSYAGLTVTIASAFVALVAWLGARQALDGSISLGDLVAALGVTQFLVGPLGRLAYAGSELAQARASASHIDAALNAAPAVVGGSVSLDQVRGELVIHGLRHGSLVDVSLRIGSGEMVAVVADPLDAAALVACLDRSVDPDGGQVLVDGVPHTALTLTSARGAIVVAHHDAPILADSITADITAPARRTANAGGEAARATTARSSDLLGGPPSELDDTTGPTDRTGRMTGPTDRTGSGTSHDDKAKDTTGRIDGTNSGTDDIDSSAGQTNGPIGRTGGGNSHDDRANDTAGQIDVTNGGSDGVTGQTSGPIGRTGGGSGPAGGGGGAHGGGGDGGVGVGVGVLLDVAGFGDIDAAVVGGRDGVMTESGRSLSGGQRQRVVLARALATGAPVLVLHEPTTAVDTATEQRIAQRLKDHRAGRTTVLVTSSPTLLAQADRAVLLRDGRVVAEGPHATLLRDHSDYRETVLR